MSSLALPGCIVADKAYIWAALDPDLAARGVHVWQNILN